MSIIGNTLPGNGVEQLVEAEEREGEVETMKSEAFIKDFLAIIFNAWGFISNASAFMAL